MQAVSVTPVVGLPQVNGWSQVIDHVFGGIHLIATIAVQGENAGSVGRDIVSMVLDQEPSNAQHVYKFLQYLVGYSHKNHCELSITLGLFADGRCTLTSRHGTVWLKRLAKVGALVEAAQDVALLEGSAKDDDTFIFSTSQAQQFLPTIELQFGQGYDVDGVITSIVPAVHSLENSSLNALAFVTVGQPSHTYIATRQSVDAVPQDLPTEMPQKVRPETSGTDYYSSQAAPQGSELFPQNKTLANSEAATNSPENHAKPSIGEQLAAVTQFLTSIPRIFSKKTYVGNHVSQKSMLWIIGLIAVVVIGLGIGIYYVLHMKDEQTFAAELVSPYSARIIEAEAIAQSDPISARNQLDQVISELVALQSEYNESGRKRVVTSLDETVLQARNVQSEVAGKQEFSQLPIFYDLRLASADFLTTLATVQGQKAIFVDSQKKRAIVLDLPSKQIFPISLESVDPTTSVSPQEEGSIAVLANGVYSVALAQDAIPAAIKELGDSNRSASFVNTFGSYVYVFNPEKRNIYRYSKPPKTDTYSEPVGWLQDPLGVSFETVKSFMIDGDVWMSTTQGEILKFSAGKAANFTVAGMQEPLASPTFIFTQESTSNIYALEPEKKRLVILTKTGQFIREVRSDSLASATVLLVSEQLGKAFAVSGSIVYEVAL